MTGISILKREAVGSSAASAHLERCSRHGEIKLGLASSPFSSCIIN